MTFTDAEVYALSIVVAVFQSRDQLESAIDVVAELDTEVSVALMSALLKIGSTVEPDAAAAALARVDQLAAQLEHLKPELEALPLIQRIRAADRVVIDGVVVKDRFGHFEEPA